jgi:hypothetical protein
MVIGQNPDDKNPDITQTRHSQTRQIIIPTIINLIKSDR